MSPKRKFRPVTPRVTVTCPPLPQVPPKPSKEVPPTVRADNPWPGAGKMSGNLFEERNWLLPKGYLAIENKKDDIDMPSLKEELKVEKQSDNCCTMFYRLTSTLVTSLLNGTMKV